MGLPTPFRIPPQDTEAAAAKLIELRRNALGFYTQPDESVRLFVRHKAALMFAELRHATGASAARRRCRRGLRHPRVKAPSPGSIAGPFPATPAMLHLAHDWINHLLGDTASRLLVTRQGLANTVSPVAQDASNGRPHLAAARRKRLADANSCGARVPFGYQLSKVMTPCRLGIVWRTGIALALVGVLASGLTGYYRVHRKPGAAAIGRRTTPADRHPRAGAPAQRGTGQRQPRRADGGAQHPGTTGLLQTWESQAPQQPAAAPWRRCFKHHLAHPPEYFQMRLIAAADHGAERVRVDRSDEGLLRVFEEDLQEKGHYPYVMETLRLPAGAVYVSRASINHEMGAHAGRHAPLAASGHARVRRAATGAGADRGQHSTWPGCSQQLAADLPDTLSLYLSNSQGDFLIHPTRSRPSPLTAASARWCRTLFLIPGSLIGDHVEDGPQQLVTLQATDTPEQALVAAFVRQPLVGLHNDEGFVIGLGQPLRSVLADADQLGRTSLRIVLAFSALAIVLAALLARRLSKPLHQLLRALRENRPRLARCPAALARDASPRVRHPGPRHRRNADSDQRPVRLAGTETAGAGSPAPATTPSRACPTGACS